MKGLRDYLKDYASGAYDIRKDIAGIWLIQLVMQSTCPEERIKLTDPRKFIKY
jgi:hypothetical protein